MYGDAFVESRRPTQNVCNLNEASDGQCLEIDVRSCRLNGIIEANCEDIPIFSPLDEIVRPRKGFCTIINGWTLVPSAVL